MEVDDLGEQIDVEEGEIISDDESGETSRPTSSPSQSPPAVASQGQQSWNEWARKLIESPVKITPTLTPPRNIIPYVNTCVPPPFSSQPLLPYVFVPPDSKHTTHYPHPTITSATGDPVLSTSPGLAPGAPTCHNEVGTPVPLLFGAEDIDLRPRRTQLITVPLKDGLAGRKKPETSPETREIVGANPESPVPETYDDMVVTYKHILEELDLFKRRRHESTGEKQSNEKNDAIDSNKLANKVDEVVSGEKSADVMNVDADSSNVVASMCDAPQSPTNLPCNKEALKCIPLDTQQSPQSSLLNVNIGEGLWAAPSKKSSDSPVLTQPLSAKIKSASFTTPGLDSVLQLISSQSLIDCQISDPTNVTRDEHPDIADSPDVRPPDLSRIVSSSDDPELLEMQLRLAALESTLQHNYKKDKKQHEDMQIKLAETFRKSRQEEIPEEGELVVNKVDEIHIVKKKITQIVEKENEKKKTNKEVPSPTKKRRSGVRSRKVAERAMKLTDSKKSTVKTPTKGPSRARMALTLGGIGKCEPRRERSRSRSRSRDRRREGRRSTPGKQRCRSKTSATRQWHKQQRQRILKIGDPDKQVNEFRKLLKEDTTSENYEQCSMEIDSQSEDDFTVFTPRFGGHIRPPPPRPLILIPPYIPGGNMIFLPPPPPPPPLPRVLPPRVVESENPRNESVLVLDDDNDNQAEEIGESDGEDEQLLRELLLKSLNKKKDENGSNGSESPGQSTQRQVHHDADAQKMVVNFANEATNLVPEQRGIVNISTSSSNGDRRVIVKSDHNDYHNNQSHTQFANKTTFTIQVQNEGCDILSSLDTSLDFEAETEENEVLVKCGDQPNEQNDISPNDNVDNILNNLLQQGRETASRIASQETPKVKRPKSSLDERLRSCKKDLDRHRACILNDKIRIQTLTAQKKAEETHLKECEETKKEVQKKLHVIERETRDVHLKLESMEKERKMIGQRLKMNVNVSHLYETQWNEIQSLAQAKGAATWLTTSNNKSAISVETCKPEVNTPLDIPVDNDADVLVWFRGYRLCETYRTLRGLSLCSATFYSQLDPDVPLCPYAISGECADSSCKWQHPRQFLPSPELAVADLLSYGVEEGIEACDIRLQARRIVEETQGQDFETILLAALEELRENCDKTQLGVPLKSRAYRPRAHNPNHSTHVDVPAYMVFDPETRKRRYFSGQLSDCVAENREQAQLAPVRRNFPKKKPRPAGRPFAQRM